MFFHFFTQILLLVKKHSLFFLRFFLIALFLALNLIVIKSCYPPADKTETAEPVKVDTTTEPTESEDLEIDSYSQTRCRKGDIYSEEVSLRNLDFVDSTNVGEYPLQGECEVDDALVYVTVNGYGISRNPKCDNGRWKVDMDLTSIATEEENVVFHITHNKESICKEVRVAFLGPRNYIPVPPLEDFYKSGFYVMKYEAKIDGRGASTAAISKAEGKPLSRVSYEEALELCQNNGSRYDLMRNDQWQTIARNIEQVAENWAEGRSTPSDNNTLNCGLFRGNPLPADEDDDNDCASASCASGWDENRRTHWLNNGEKIWDMCGNLGEMMKDKYREDEAFEDFVYNFPRSLKKIFGPKRTYRLVNAGRRSNDWNLGYAKIDEEKNLIIRGAPAKEAGIFSVDISSDQTNRRAFRSDVGFRCVYIP